MEEEVTIPKILTVKRRGDDDYFGQKLSDISVMAFEAREHCDVRIISSEGQFLNAHQVSFMSQIINCQSFERILSRCKLYIYPYFIVWF